MSELRILNTLSGEKEPFVPVQAGKAGIYCCGPTVYNFIHVGNGRPLVVFDTVRRYLLYKGYDVTYVVNFTDVDDKIINRAGREGREAPAVAGQYIEEYFKDSDALGALRADIYPRVSGHMPEIIAFVAALIREGKAYELEGDVYYSVEKFAGYGKLSNRSREDLLDGARVDVDQRKRNAADFALWKKAKPGEPFWESPWGPGRPGWHIECSAMSQRYLGESFDIHGGGADLIFPHHENEIAQSEGRFGRPMAKYWMHNGFITINREKMSKSLGNFFLVREVLEKFSGQVIRFYLLSVHYRSPLDFDDEKLAVAQKGLERLKNAVRASAAVAGAEPAGPEAGGAESGGPGEGAAGAGRPGADRAESGGLAAADRNPGGSFRGSADAESDPAVRAFLSEVADAENRFEDAMNDDFNTALAIAALFDLARALNTFAGTAAAAETAAAATTAAAAPGAGGGSPAAKALETGRARLLALAGVLGLELTEAEPPGEEDRELNQALGVLLSALRPQSAGQLQNSGQLPQSTEQLPPEAGGVLADSGTAEGTVEEKMAALLALRQEFRKAKNFAGADKIRDGLKAAGVAVEDTPQGPRWHKL